MARSGMNRTAAKEWLIIAFHDLKSAQILFEANHYTDSIGNVLQQSIEKMLKSILAYDNKQIKKTHDLVEIYNSVKYKITINENNIDFLEKATEYFTEDRYPNPNYSLPSRDEIKEVLCFAENLFDKVCKTFNFEKNKFYK